MTTSHLKKLLRIVALALLIGQQGVFALLSIDGTRNQVYFIGGLTFGYDSNLFSDSSGRDDYTFTARLGMEYKRRAGIIAVDANAYIDILRFKDFDDQNAENPHFGLILEKTTGRTTGTFSISAFRASRSDSAVNLRTNSWNLPIALYLKYPVNDRYYFTSNTAYNGLRYIDNVSLLNYQEVSEDVNLFYVYTSKLDLSGGYRIRFGETELGHTVDHNFTIGASGGLLPKLSGTVRFGYQIRNDDTTGETYDALSAAASLSWTATRKLTVDANFSRDFNTAANGVTVDTSSATLTGIYAFSRRFRGELGIGGGKNRYVSGVPPQRDDTYANWNIEAIYTLNEHVTFTAAYTYFKNWSTLPSADYDRDVVTFDVSSQF